jgi:hypothetical protein
VSGDARDKISGSSPVEVKILQVPFALRRLAI